MFKRLSILGCFLVTGSLFTACGDELDNVLDCSDVCNRYQECIDADYDVDSCVNECQADAGSSPDKEARLEKCDNCIEDRSCTGAAFACATECVGVIPAQ